MNAFTSTSNTISYPFVSTSYETSMQPEAFVALGSQPQQYQLLRQNPQYQLQPHQVNQQRHQQIAHLPIQQPVFDFNNPQHIPLNQHSPTGSISNAFEAYPPHLSNSPESGLSVRSNSPSAAGSPRLANNCVAPGLQASRGAGVAPTFIHQDSYGSDQSQPYETMYNPVTTSTEKAGGFVGESRKLSSLHSSCLALQNNSEFFKYPQFFYEHSSQDKAEDYITPENCPDDTVDVGIKGIVKQHIVGREGGGDDTSFHGASTNAVFYDPEVPQRLKKTEPSAAERCNFPNVKPSDKFPILSSELSMARSSSFSPSLEEIPEFLSHYPSHAKDCVDVNGLQNTSCLSPFRDFAFF